MAILRLPVHANAAAYEFTVELEGKTYLMRFRWNERMGRWLMDVAKVDGADVVAGVPLLVNTPLLDRFASPDLPPGRFLIRDEASEPTIEATAARSPGRSELGGDILLVYEESTT